MREKSLERLRVVNTTDRKGLGSIGSYPTSTSDLKREINPTPTPPGGDCGTAEPRVCEVDVR